MLEAMNTKPLNPKAESTKVTSPSESESQTLQSDPTLYEKVAQDLETLFSGCPMLNPNVYSFNEEGGEVEKNTKNSLDLPHKNCVKMKRRTPRNEIEHKIVHTRNDTLHIWTAYV